MFAVLGSEGRGGAGDPTGADEAWTGVSDLEPVGLDWHPPEGLPGMAAYAGFNRGVPCGWR